MTRWLCARGIAIVLACGTFTVAQSPAPTPQVGDIFTFRTAGQPERKVKIVRIAPFSDGESLADVEDVASGAKYTIPAKVLMASARTVARVPERVSATPPRPAESNGWPKTPKSNVKQAGFPTSLPTPMPAKGTPSPFEQRTITSTPKPSATTGTTMLHGLGSALPPMPKPLTVTYPSYDGLPVPRLATTDVPLIAPIPDGPIVPKVPLAPVDPDTLPPMAPPTSGALILPGAIAEPTVEFPIQPPSLVPGGVNPSLVPEAPTTADPPVPAPVAPALPNPIVEVVPRPLPIATQPMVRIETLPPLPAPVTIVPVGLMGAAANQMIDETTPLLHDLTQALRPSVRERAATALAEGRYGWRTEVKAELARSAANDPATSVRAHCIQLLSKLGYHDSAYLDQLAGWAESDSVRVREAARAAMAKLGPRN